MGFRKSLDCEHSIIMEEPGMNGIILYQSKYGATKKYAQWLSEKTGFPCAETKQARLSDVREYDTILILSCLKSADLSKYKDRMRPLIEKDIAETVKILTTSGL